MDIELPISCCFFFSSLREKARNSFVLIHFPAELLTRRIWINKILLLKLPDIEIIYAKDNTISLNSAVSWIFPFFTKLCEFLPNNYCYNCNNVLSQNLYRELWTNLRHAIQAVISWLLLNNNRFWMQTS